MKLFVAVILTGLLINSCSPTSPEGDIAKEWEVHNRETTSSIIQSDFINDIAVCESNQYIWVVSQGEGVSRFNIATGTWGYFVDDDEKLLNQQFYKIASFPPYVFAVGENTVVKFSDVDDVEIFIDNTGEFNDIAFLDNNIYLSNVDGGIIKAPIYSAENNYSEFDIYHQDFIFTMITAGFDKIWATTDTAGIFNISKDLEHFDVNSIIYEVDQEDKDSTQTEETIADADTIKRSEKIFSAHTGADGYVYFSLGDEILCFDGQYFAYHTKGSLIQNNILFVTRDHTSMLWVLSEFGIFTYKNNWLHYTGEYINDAKKIVVSPTAGVWIATHSKGVITDFNFDN